MYSYDMYGWYTEVPNPNRDAGVAPPTCANGEKANWTGTHWVCVTYVEPPPYVPPAPPPIRDISKREFLKRLTPAEYSAIKGAAAANATVDYYWQMFMLVEGDIHLDNPDTIDGLQLLESAGLLAAGRANEILS